MTHKPVLSLVVCLMSIALGGRVLAHDTEPKDCRWISEVNETPATIFPKFNDSTSVICMRPYVQGGVSQWIVSGVLKAMIFTPAMPYTDVVINGYDDRPSAGPFIQETHEVGTRSELRRFVGAGVGRASCSVDLEGPAGSYLIQGVAGVHARCKVKVSASITGPSGIWQDKVEMERAKEVASHEGLIFPGGIGAFGFSLNLPFWTDFGEGSGEIPVDLGSGFDSGPMSATRVFILEDARVATRTSLTSRNGCSPPMLGSSVAKARMYMGIQSDVDLETSEECD